MAVTIHLPQVHQPNMKRLAAAGVAVLATAVAFAGIQAITNNTNSATSTSDGVVDVTTVDAVGNSEVAEWAQQYGLSGLSPASVGPVTTTAGAGLAESIVGATDNSAVADWAQQYGLSGLSPASVGSVTAPTVAEGATATNAATRAPAFSSTATAADTPTAPMFSSSAPATEATASAVADWSQFTTGALSTDAVAGLAAFGVIAESPAVVAEQSGGYTTQAEFLAVNGGSFAVEPQGQAVTAEQSGGYTTQAEFLAVNGDSFAVEPQGTAAATTGSEYDPYPPDAATEVTYQPRSNFASEIDWLNANGWTGN